jgi:hypothetical protein
MIQEGVSTGRVIDQVGDGVMEEEGQLLVKMVKVVSMIKDNTQYPSRF